MRGWLLAGLALVLLIAGCDDNAGGGTETTGGAEPARGADSDSVAKPRAITKGQPGAFSGEPYLRGILPEQTALYVRLPAPTDFIAGPGDTALASAKRAEAHIEAVRAIRDALERSHLKGFGKGAAIVELLIKRLRAPLEIALIPPEEGRLLKGRMLVTARLDFEGVGAVNRYLAELVDLSPRLSVEQRLGSDRDAVVSVDNSELRLQWQAEDQRLIGLLDAQSVSANALDKRLAGLSEGDGHPMHEAEAEIDTGHGGFFVWANREGFQALTQVIAPSSGWNMYYSPVALQQRLGDPRWVAFGWGSKAPLTDDGRAKSRLKFLAAGPRRGFREVLPAPSNELDITGSGDIDWAVTLALPDAQTWQQMDTGLDAAFEGGFFYDSEDYASTKEAIQGYVGLSISELVKAVGPELVAFSDEAGTFAATRIDEEADREALWRRLTNKGPVVTRNTYGHDGRTYYETLIDRSVPGVDMERGLPTFSLGWMLNVSDRAYWVSNDDYLIQAASPQALIERERYHRATAVSEWLKREQGQDLEHAVAAASVSIPGGPRFVYRHYLKFLDHLGDAVGAPVDMFAFPTATEAGIPKHGSYGIQVNNGPERFAVELTFEHTPADIALISPYTAAAMGNAAATASQAYEEYQGEVEASQEQLRQQRERAR